MTADKPNNESPAHLAGEAKFFIMIATTPISPNIEYNMHITALSTDQNHAHTWLINSAASSHLSGNSSLFSDLTDTPPITIITASGDSFMANQSEGIYPDEDCLQSITPSS